MRSKSWIAAAVAVLLSACGSIERTVSVQQPLDKGLIAGPGDVMLRIDREKSLPNVVGKADLWGRKTNEGFTEVRFAGVELDGQVVLYRKDVHIVSNETTMSRTPMSITSASATSTLSGTATTVGGNTQISGTGRTVGSAVTINSAAAYHIAVPSDTIAIRLGPNERRIPISGYVIEVLSAGASSIEYRVTRQPQ